MRGVIQPSVLTGANSGLADALIVGTALKDAGDWRRPVDETRVRALRDALS